MQWELLWAEGQTQYFHCSLSTADKSDHELADCDFEMLDWSSRRKYQWTAASRSAASARPGEYDGASPSECVYSQQ